MKIDSLRIGEKHDGRRKITDEQRAEIKHLYENEKKTIYYIYKKIGCSKRAVQFILFPERLAVVQQHAKAAKRWEPYNTADIRREVMRKHRAKKRELVKSGQISLDVNSVHGREINT